MRFSVAALLAAAAGVVSAESVTYVTEVVTAYTTVCPVATTFSYGVKTYTVTAPTTLVLTEGPYTVTKPVLSVTSSVVCGSCVTPLPAPANATYTTSAPVSTFSGAANSQAHSGAGLAAVVAMAAWLL